MNTPETMPVFESIPAFVDEHYEQEAAFVDKRFCVGNETLGHKEDAPIPTLEEIQAAFDSLSESQLKAICSMNQPVLQLVPYTPGKRYVQAFGDIDVDFSFYASIAFNLKKDKGIDRENERIVGWKAAVTEGACKVESELEKVFSSLRTDQSANQPGFKMPTIQELGIDNSADLLGRRVDCFNQRCEKKGISGADMQRHMLLMMRAFDQVPARLIDDTFGDSTLFCECVGLMVIHGYWDQTRNCVVYADIHGKERLTSSYFRTSVMVNVPQPLPKDSSFGHGEVQFRSAPQEEPCGAVQALARDQISQAVAGAGALDDK